MGIQYASAVSNGTVALHLALLALGIGPGDEVIVPTLTYIAPVNAIAYVGATPVFVDSDKDTWQMDMDDVERKITDKTKAVIAVHLYGYPCNMIRLNKLQQDHNIFLIEDCAEAFGSRIGNGHAGTFGDIATFSFFGNKSITTGEGGMVVTGDKTLHERVLHFKGQGLAKDREYWHDTIGYNYRMTNICAAIGCAQLEQAAVILQKKRQIANWYMKYLEGVGVVFHQEVKHVSSFKHSYWMCSILVDDSSKREPLRKYLLENHGIETRPVFYPVHTMPMYSQKYQRHPVAEDIGWRGINLPSYPDLIEDDVAYICEKIKIELELLK